MVRLWEGFLADRVFDPDCFLIISHHFCPNQSFGQVLRGIFGYKLLDFFACLHKLSLNVMHLCTVRVAVLIRKPNTDRVRVSGKRFHSKVKNVWSKLHRMLDFGLMLHFASKVDTFRVNITFYDKSGYICFLYYILR